MSNSGQHLTPAQVENNHLESELHYNSSDISQLSSEFPLLELTKIPDALLYHLFVDYKFFDCGRGKGPENWRSYNDREPGCVGDLFRTFSEIAFKYLDPTNQHKDVSMKHLVSLNTSLAKSVASGGSTEVKPGVFREGWHTFPFVEDTITKEGAMELLTRILADNNPDGFMIGSLHKMNIPAIFCGCLYDQKDKVSGEGTDTEPAFDLLKKAAIQETIKQLKDDLHGNTENTLKTHLDKYIDTNVEKIKAIIEIYVTTHSLADKKKSQLLQLPNEFWNLPPIKEEFQLEIDYSRQRALARPGSYSNSDIVTVADEILKVVRDQGRIHLFAPKAEVAQQMAQTALNTYNTNIKTANDPQRKISLIGDLAQEVDILHLFNDCNCRMSNALSQMLLLINNLNTAIQYNPNRVEGLSREQRVEQIKQGITRLHYIAAQAEEMEKREARVNQEYDKAMKYDNKKITALATYSDIINPFKAELIDLIKKIKATFLNGLIEKYANKADAQAGPLLSTGLFSTTSIANQKLMQEALIKLRNANETQGLDALDKMSIPGEMKQDIKKIKNLISYELTEPKNTNSYR